MNHDFILDGEDSILSGGSSILIDGGLPAERFTNSTASFDRREERTRQHRHKKIIPGEHRYQRGQTRASTAPEHHNPEDVPAYSVFLPTIGVEVTASGGRFSVTQRRSPDRRVWRERKSTRPRTTIGPMLSEPSVEDMDGFDKDYGDRPTPIIAASPQQIIRIRPLDSEPMGQRTIVGGVPMKKSLSRSSKNSKSNNNGMGGAASSPATLAAYFQQQGPRAEDVVWAGDGGHYPGTGNGISTTPHVRNAPHTAPHRSSARSSAATTTTDDEFNAVQQQSPYWAPKPVPKYFEHRVQTADAGGRRRKRRSDGGSDMGSDMGSDAGSVGNDDDVDERRKFLTTPDLNTIVSRDVSAYLSRESLKSLLSDSVDSLTGRRSRKRKETQNNNNKKKHRQRPRTVQAYMAGHSTIHSDMHRSKHTRSNPGALRAKTAATTIRPLRGGASQGGASSSSLGTSLRIATRGKHRGGIMPRPGTAMSLSSDKSQEYIACAACHRQRSKFSDFCNVCVKKMSARRKLNTAEQRALWSREGKSATFLLELSGTTDGMPGTVTGTQGKNQGTRGTRGTNESNGASNQAAMDIAITRLTFNEATSTNRMLREARLDAVAAAKKRGAGSLHGWLDALAMSSEANHAIQKVQAVFRGFYCRAMFRRGKECVVRLQSMYWGRVARERVRVLRTRWNAAITVQALSRGVSIRSFWNLDKMIPAILIIQTAYRGYLGRMELRRLKYLQEMIVRNAKAWMIQGFVRQRIARNTCHYKRALKQGSEGLQKTYRMYLERKWFLVQKVAAIVLESRLIRRRLAQNRAERLRTERDRVLKALRVVQDAAIQKVQRVGRVWLACRLVDRLREKYDDAMEAIEMAKVNYDECGASGEWPNEELYLEYTFFLQFLKKDLTEAGRVYRAGIGRHSETNGAPLLNYGYALMLALRRNTQQNDADESERRLTNAFKNDPVRTAARRVELMLRCLIKLDGLNPDILATYAVFHTMLRNYPSARRYYMRAIKLDPYNDKIVGSFAELEEMEVRKRATIRGETPTAWFKEGEDFQFEELALDEVERSVVFSTLQEEEDGKRERKDQAEIKRDQDRENEQRTKKKNTITHTNLEHQKLKQSKIAMKDNYLNRQDAMLMAEKKKQSKHHTHSKAKTSNNNNPIENPEEEIQKERNQKERNQEVNNQEEKNQEEKNHEETTVVKKKKTLMLKQDKKKASSIRLLFTCKMLGQNVMIEGVQIWHPPSALLIELGLANPYRPDDFPDPAPVYRMFLSDLDVRMFVNVLDMSHLLHARHRTKLLKMMLDRIVLVPPKNKAVNSMPQLGIEFRQDPWLSVGIVSKSNIYMSVQVQMVDFMAERLARKEEEESKRLMNLLSDDDEEEDGTKKKKKKKKKKKVFKKKKVLTQKQQMELFARKEKGLPPAKKKRKRKSVFDVVALPEELERLVAEQTRVVKAIELAHPVKLKNRNSRPGSRGGNSRPGSRGGAAIEKKRIKTDVERMAEDVGSSSSDESSSDDEEEEGKKEKKTYERKMHRQDRINLKLSKGRHIVFNAHIPKMKKQWKLRVNGTLISKMFCDKPLLIRQFMRPGWRLGARPLVMRLANMLDLVHSHDTPRVYEKKYVRGADGKFVETVVDVTPAHAPTQRLMLVGLRERMQEATNNIAATEIQRVIRGVHGRAFAKNVVPINSATTIQRCWRGRIGRILGHHRKIFVTRYRGARGMQSITRRAIARIYFTQDLAETMPFSNGRWDVVHAALSIQRDSIAAYDADPDNLVACFRASLFQHTLTTPIQADKAAEGYMKVLEGHAGHNASLHFCIGVLLLSGHRLSGQATWSDEQFVQYMSQRMQGLTQTKQQLLDKEDDKEWEKTMARAHVHIRKGYTMDPGGNRFSIVEEAYFQRAASIHPLNADANLSYGVVLFEIRKDPTTALLYLRQALQLQTELYEACLVALKEERLVLNSAPSPSRRKELNMKEMINRYNYDRVCNVVRRTEQQVQGLSGKWAPVQALWRGHWDRCSVGLSVVHGRDKVKQERIPNDARRVLRLALSYHTIVLDYELADGMYRKARKIDPNDPCILYAHAVLLVALLAKEEHQQPKLGTQREKLDQNRLHQQKIKNIEQLVATAIALDSSGGTNQYSYQWMEMEYFLPSVHRAWDPAGALGLHRRKVVNATTPTKQRRTSPKGSGGSRGSGASRGSGGGSPRVNNSGVGNGGNGGGGMTSVPNSPSSAYRDTNTQDNTAATAPPRTSSPTTNSRTQRIFSPLKKKKNKNQFVDIVVGNNGLRIEKDKERCARCCLNYGLFRQWVMNDIGQANMWFTKALAMAPGDTMVNGCYHEFFNRGLAFTLTKDEVQTTEKLKKRRFWQRESRKEKETRLRRLEEERIKRITVQEMEKERYVRQSAFDRITENHRRHAMLKEDVRMMARLKNVENQRKSILGSIGKSQADIAKERKKQREDAKRKKKDKQKAAKKAAKKKKKKG